jgi:hypothetical protein
MFAEEKGYVTVDEKHGVAAWISDLKRAGIPV